MKKLKYLKSFKESLGFQNELQLIEENWKGQGESDPEYEKDVLEYIKGFNSDLKRANVTIEDLQNREKLEDFLINYKRYSLGNSHRCHTVSFNFSHIKNGRKIYFYDDTSFWKTTESKYNLKGKIVQIKNEEEYHTCYLIEDDKCVGVCKYGLQIIEGKKFYMIKDIFVLSSKRRKGYGTDILNHIEKIHPGYSYYDDTTTTIKGDRFFHKVKGSPIFHPENKY
jgi:GNAT superfamily N-acetyltransferase